MSVVVFAENILLLVSSYNGSVGSGEEACTQLAAIVRLLTAFPLLLMDMTLLGSAFVGQHRKNSLANKTNRHFYGVSGKGMHSVHPLSFALWEGHSCQL